MRKKNIIIIIVVLALLVLGIISNIKFNKGYTITINNNADKTVANLELRYKVGDTIQTISQIEAKKSWKDNIDTSNIKGENSIILKYKDNKGNFHEECVVGYLEKGYTGNVNVNIKKIDDSKLVIEVE